MTETTEIRMREIHGRTRRYRARYEAWRLSWLALCGLILLTGIGLLMNSGQSPSVAAVADGYGAVLLRDGAGAYIVIGLLAFTLGVAATVLCIRLKDRAARRMPEEDAGDGGGHEHGK